MPRQTPFSHQISEIYIDESSQTKHRYLGLGGLIVHLESRPSLENAIQAARQPELPNGELKWTKVSAAKLPAYKRVVDLFFDGVEGVVPLQYHSLIVDTSKINDALHNSGSRETGFNKEVYQLCQKFGRLYRDRLFHIYPDNRTTPSDPEDLRLILNRGIKKNGDNREWPFRRVHFRNSHASQVLQLTDVLLGAFLFSLNGHRASADASKAKCELSDYVLERAGISDPFVDTRISGKYTVWHRRLKTK